MNDGHVFLAAILANLLTWPTLRTVCLIVFAGGLVLVFVLILIGSYLSGRQPDVE